MTLRSTQLGVAVYLAPEGPLTADTADDLVAGARAAQSAGAIHVVVDLADVPLLDSRALEVLLELAGELRDAGGSLRIAGPNPLCSDVLRVTRLDQMIPVFADREGAGGSFL